MDYSNENELQYHEFMNCIDKYNVHDITFIYENKFKKEHFMRLKIKPYEDVISMDLILDDLSLEGDIFKSKNLFSFIFTKDKYLNPFDGSLNNKVKINQLRNKIFKIDFKYEYTTISIIIKFPSYSNKERLEIYVIYYNRIYYCKSNSNVKNKIKLLDDLNGLRISNISVQFEAKENIRDKKLVLKINKEKDNNFNIMIYSDEDRLVNKSIFHKSYNKSNSLINTSIYDDIFLENKYDTIILKDGLNEYIIIFNDKLILYFNPYSLDEFNGYIEYFKFKYYHTNKINNEFDKLVCINKMLDKYINFKLNWYRKLSRKENTLISHNRKFKWKTGDIFKKHETYYVIIDINDQINSFITLDDFINNKFDNKVYKINLSEECSLLFLFNILDPIFNDKENISKLNNIINLGDPLLFPIKYRYGIYNRELIKEYLKEFNIIIKKTNLNKLYLIYKGE